MEACAYACMYVYLCVGIYVYVYVCAYTNVDDFENTRLNYLKNT